MLRAMTHALGVLSLLAICGGRALAQEPPTRFGHFPYAVAPKAELRALTVNPNKRVHREAWAATEALLAEARAAGFRFIVFAAHRTLEDQRILFEEGAKQKGLTLAQRAREVAPPGYSEHHTGFALDFGDPRHPKTHKNATFAKTDAYRWLQAHAPAHGFELSFPEGNAQGVTFEPWHWRFVGSEGARKVFARGRSPQGPPPN